MAYGFLYDPALGSFELSESHPFKPIRLELTRSLLSELVLLKDAQLTAIETIDEASLAGVHQKRYIDMVKAVSQGQTRAEAYSYGLGTGDNPIFPKMHEAIMGICSATVTAVDKVASGELKRAVNLAGGLHHALADKASGFCVYNDLALGIEHAVKHYGLRVAYVDLDAHHGDGVQWLFYDRAEVMTISLHESGRYLFPGTGYTYELGRHDGRGLSVNVPLEPFSEDDSFVECFEAVVPLALRRFKPDLIVLQAGADMHRYDPLADLALSTRAMAKSYQRISELADELCDGKLVATGGGGYDPYRTVPRAWALLWATVSRQQMPELLPESWRQRWQAQSPETMPEQTFDDVSSWKEIPRRPQIEAQNRATVKRLLATLEPIWRERFG